MDIPWNIIESNEYINIRKLYFNNYNNKPVSIRKGILGALNDLYIYQNNKLPESIDDKKIWITNSINNTINNINISNKLKKKIWIFKVLINYNYKINFNNYKKNIDYIDNIKYIIVNSNCIYHYINIWLQLKISNKRLHNSIHDDNDDDNYTSKKYKYTF